MEEVTSLRSKRVVRDALASRNGPDVTAIHGAEIGSDVIIWREAKKNQRGYWQGPFKLLSVIGETCMVDTGTKVGSQEFRTSSVRSWYDDGVDEVEGRAFEPLQDDNEPSIVY